MNPELELEQKAFRTKIGYRFFDDYVEYTIRDSRGDKASFSVKYGDLPPKFDYRVFQPKRAALSVQVVILLFLTLLLLVLYPKEAQDVLVFMTLYGAMLLGLSAFLRKRFFAKIYTSLPTRNGKLLILRDRRHDEVLGALEARRLKALRKFAMVDVLNAPQAELKKLRWLREEGVLTAEEFENYARMLAPAATAAAAAAGGDKDPLTLKQEAFRYNSQFRFHERHLEYVMDDGAQTAFNIRYNDLPHPTEYRTFLKRDALVGLVFMGGLLAGMALLDQHAQDSYYLGPEGLRHLALGALLYLPVLAAIVYAAHRYSKKEFTIVPVSKGTLRVLHDGQRDKIVSLLQDRRQSALRAFAVIDGVNAPQAELRKFLWLKEQGAITDEEFALFRQKLLDAIASQPAAAQGGPLKPPSETLH